MNPVLPGLARIVVRYFRSSIFSFVFFLFTAGAAAQSGTAFSLDGVDDRIDLPHILNNTDAASYTSEAWVYAPLNAGSFNNIVSGTQIAFWFPDEGGGLFRLSAGHSASGFTAVRDPNPMQANTWTHVAVTYDAATTTMRLYKNGVQVDVDAGVPNHANGVTFIGSFNGGFLFNGLMDEVRVWGTALSQTEIRDWMCRKVTAAHPQWANMLGYYKADEGSGTTAIDSRNTNNGTIVGAATWVTSGAAIGDASAYDYVNTLKTASLSPVLPYSEIFTATEVSGGLAGIQVYRVDALPNSTTGIQGLGNNNKYFGVFPIGGTTPSVNIVFNYGTNTTSDENTIRLFTRADNSVATWTINNTTPNVTTNEITVTATAATEYILGSIGTPLPVNFTNFSVAKEGSKVRLRWATSTERNNASFVVQRRTPASGWVAIGSVPGSGNSNSVRNYSFADEQPANGVNLYRLQQVDTDGTARFSDQRRIDFSATNSVVVYPVPVLNSFTLDLASAGQYLNTEAQVVDASGKTAFRFRITNVKQQVPVSHLTSGVYFIRLADGTSYRFNKE